jgi:hypothetical protein
MAIELRRVDDIVIRKVATFCRTLSFAKSVKVEGRGDSHRRVIVLETKDLDIVEIAAVTLPTRIDIGGVSNVKPTIVEDNTMYAPIRGFPNGTASEAEIKDFIKKSYAPKDLMSKKYKEGTVVYRKTRYQ